MTIYDNKIDEATNPKNERKVDQRGKLVETEEEKRLRKEALLKEMFDRAKERGMTYIPD